MPVASQNYTNLLVTFCWSNCLSCGNQKVQLITSNWYYALQFLEYLRQNTPNTAQTEVSVQQLILIRSPTISLEYKINIIVVHYFLNSCIRYISKNVSTCQFSEWSPLDIFIPHTQLENVPFRVLHCVEESLCHVFIPKSFFDVSLEFSLCSLNI